MTETDIAAMEADRAVFQLCLDRVAPYMRDYPDRTLREGLAALAADAAAPEHHRAWATAELDRMLRDR